MFPFHSHLQKVSFIVYYLRFLNMIVSNYTNVITDYIVGKLKDGGFVNQSNLNLELPALTALMTLNMLLNSSQSWLLFALKKKKMKVSTLLIYYQVRLFEFGFRSQKHNEICTLGYNGEYISQDKLYNV